MSNEDNKTVSENLLKDKSLLKDLISEGEIVREEVVAVTETPASDLVIDQKEVIQVHSNNPNMKWYIVYVKTGQETKAKEQLEMKIKTEAKPGDFGHVLVPTENIVEMYKGKKKTTSRKFYPGYMLVQMVMSEENWHFVKSMSRIVGFVGGNTNPPSIKEKEVLKITAQVEEGNVKPVPRVSFEEGENVRVTDGPFTNFTGIVEEVKPDKAKLKVLVSIFGRMTPVELEFVQVEKI
jgi:transcription termination/antitermination protein NusG